MNTADVKPLNKMLADFEVPALQNVDIRIDTFHLPYRKFESNFIWPSINIQGIQALQAKSIITILIKFLPEYVKNCHVLPKSKPGKDSNQLHLVRPSEIEGRRYLFMLKISAQYLGGASEVEIVSAPTQGVSPSVRTNRIYYQARIFPVDQISEEQGCIIDFHPKQIKEAIFHVTSKEAVRDLFSTILFDEVDYSHINESFTALFKFQNVWRPGKLFQPFVVDFLTLCLNSVYPDFSFCEIALPYFDRALTQFLETESLDNLPSEDKNFWSDYYDSWDYERDTSRAGNPHWRIKKFPSAGMSRL